MPDIDPIHQCHRHRWGLYCSPHQCYCNRFNTADQTGHIVSDACGTSGSGGTGGRSTPAPTMGSQMSLHQCFQSLQHSQSNWPCCLRCVWQRWYRWEVYSCSDPSTHMDSQVSPRQLDPGPTDIPAAGDCRLDLGPTEVCQPATGSGLRPDPGEDQAGTPGLTTVVR